MRFDSFNLMRIASEATPSVIVVALALLGNLSISTTAMAYVAGISIALMIGLKFVDFGDARRRYHRTRDHAFDRRSYWQYAGGRSCRIWQPGAMPESICSLCLSWE